MDLDSIYFCIPEAKRSNYGNTKEEQCANFAKEHPELFEEIPIDEPSLKTDGEILDYIVQYITNTLGSKDMAYKGGYILNKLIPNVRKTYDVDLSISRKELYLDVQNTLKSLGEYFIKKGLISSYELKNNITEVSSGGIKFKRKDTSGFGVDVGLHPLAYGITKMHLDFADINRFTIERSLVDKLSVLCSPKRFRRVKDLYDTFMLISLFDIDGNTLEECKKYRNIDYTKVPIDETVITQFEHAYSKLTLGSREKDLEKPAFVDIYNIVIVFLVGSNNCLDKTWFCKERKWT